MGCQLSHSNTPTQHGLAKVLHHVVEVASLSVLTGNLVPLLSTVEIQGRAHLNLCVPSKERGICLARTACLAMRSSNGPSTIVCDRPCNVIDTTDNLASNSSTRGPSHSFGEIQFGAWEEKSNNNKNAENCTQKVISLKTRRNDKKISRGTVKKCTPTWKK